MPINEYLKSRDFAFLDSTKIIYKILITSEKISLPRLKTFLIHLLLTSLADL